MMPCPSTLPLQCPPHLPPCMPPAPSTLPLTSSVAAALRSRDNRRASVCHAPPLGAFLPPIRDAPCLHGGVLPPCMPPAPSTLPLTSSVAAALRSRDNRRASVCHAPPLGAFLPPIRDAPCLHGGVLPPCMPPAPSTLPLTSSVAAARRSRGNRRASDRHAPPLGAFLPPIRDAPCLHGGVLPPTAPSPEAVPSSLLWPHRHLAALHPRATHMIPSPRTCGRRLFSLWAARQCRRVPWARQHPRSFRPKRGRPPPVRVAGVMCVIHPSQGSQGGSASTTPTHRRWGLSSHPFGVFHLHPVVLRSDGTEKSTDVGYHRMKWLLIANSTLQNPDSLRSSAFAHKI